MKPERLFAATLAGALVGWTFSTGVKSQTVRLIDVYAWGPLMIYGAMSPNLPPIFRQLLAFTGASTVTYNARNFIRLRDFPEALAMFERYVSAGKMGAASGQ